MNADQLKFKDLAAIYCFVDEIDIPHLLFNISALACSFHDHGKDT